MSLMAAPADPERGPLPSQAECIWATASRLALDKRFLLPAHPAVGDVQVVDLFAGAGGLSAGFEMLGRTTAACRVVGGADVDPIFGQSFSLNLGVPVQACDLGQLAADAAARRAFIASLNLDRDRPVVLVGGPPCQGFTAHRKRLWAASDVRNELVGAFTTIAADLQPDVIVMENVPELLSGRYWSHFAAFRSQAVGAGYRVTARIHNLAGYGVPQERFRSLVIAARDKLGAPPPLLDPAQYRTVRDAIGHLPALVPGATDPGDAMHTCTGHRASTLDVIRQVPRDGGNRPKGVGPDCLQKVDGFRDVYGRLRWDRPAVTITGYARNPASGRFIHPDQDRGLSLREAALLQGFPSNYKFVGNNDSRYQQVGNAVPARFAVALAGHVVAYLRGEREHAVHDELDLVGPTRDSFSSSLPGLKSTRREK